MNISTASSIDDQPVDNVTMENVAHELAHQWRVNEPAPPRGDGGGHCAYNAYANANRYCGMHLAFDDGHNGERGDGIVLFHYSRLPNGQADSEYLSIRQAAEPIPNN